MTKKIIIIVVIAGILIFLYTSGAFAQTDDDRIPPVSGPGYWDDEGQWVNTRTCDPRTDSNCHVTGSKYNPLGVVTATKFDPLKRVTGTKQTTS